MNSHSLTGNAVGHKTLQSVFEPNQAISKEECTILHFDVLSLDGFCSAHLVYSMHKEDESKCHLYMLM